MKWLSYSILAISIILLVLFQTAFLPVWGVFGIILHPILWGVFFINFFLNGKYIWTYVIVSALLLDIINGQFGLNIISLSLITFILNILHQHHFGLRNFLSWILTGFIGLFIYIISVFILSNTFGVIWHWYYLVDLSWLIILLFFVANLFILLIIHFLYNYWLKFFYDKRH